MTSSLVGSEMCIRDRLEGEAMVQKVPYGRRLVQGYQEVGEGRGGEAKVCLLYTSDAADDM
eukprot:4915017-Prorocentrum_lima.AAC.1